jgi:hypothetical protein
MRNAHPEPAMPARFFPRHAAAQQSFRSARALAATRALAKDD